MSTIDIALAGTADVADATKLLEQQFQEHAIELDPRAMNKAISGLIHVPSRGRALIAREEGVAIGIAILAFTWTVEHGGLVGWLDELFVTREKREDGVGARLLDRVIHLARETGCVAVELEVKTSHVRAEHLYERASFTRLARNRWSRTLSPA